MKNDLRDLRTLKNLDWKFKELQKKDDLCDLLYDCKKIIKVPSLEFNGKERCRIFNRIIKEIKILESDIDEMKI